MTEKVRPLEDRVRDLELRLEASERRHAQTIEAFSGEITRLNERLDLMGDRFNRRQDMLAHELSERMDRLDALVSKRP